MGGLFALQTNGVGMTGLHRFGRLLRQDGGGGAGGTGGAPAGGEPAPTEGGTPPAGESQPGTPPEKTFTQAEVNDILQRRLAKEAERRESADAAAKQEREAATLAEQKKFEDLAALHLKRAEAAEAKVADVETLTTRAERAEKAVELQVTALIADLPPHILELLEGKDPVSKLEYLTKNREALVGAGAGVRTGPGFTPRPANGGGASNPLAEYLQMTRRAPTQATNSR